MKPLSPQPRRGRAAVARRNQILDAFEQSGLSGAAFAREHRISYTTFCNWRQQRAKNKRVTFAQVEVTSSIVESTLVIELGSHARMCLSSVGQVDLATRLLKHLQASC